MNFEFTAARADDIDQVMALDKENFSIPWPREGYEFELDCPDSVFLVARQGAAVVGFVVLRVIGEEAEVYKIAVAGYCRRCGIGGRLLDEAVKEAMYRKAERVLLEVRVSNTAAQGLYASRGFVQLGLRRGYYDKPKEDAIIMGASLKGEAQ